MIKQIYYVEEGYYSGYASTLEEAEELERKYKCYSAESGKPITSTSSIYEKEMSLL